MLEFFFSSALPDDDKLKTPPASDDEEESTEEVGPPLPPVPSDSREQNVNAKKSTVREWDFGKEGVTSTLTQEEWVDRQRVQRNNEFAPPSVYEPNKRQKQDQSRYDHGTTSQRNQTYKSNSSFNWQTGPSNSHAVSSNHSATDLDSNIEASRQERKSEFAPPSTFEYYGPSASRGRTPKSKPQYSAMEEAISKGLSNLRKMNDN